MRDRIITLERALNTSRHGLLLQRARAQEQTADVLCQHQRGHAPEEAIKVLVGIQAAQPALSVAAYRPSPLALHEKHLLWNGDAGHWRRRGEHVAARLPGRVHQNAARAAWPPPCLTCRASARAACSRRPLARRQCRRRASMDAARRPCRGTARPPRSSAWARARFLKNRLSKFTSMFGPILVPTWPHFGTKNRPQSGQRKIPRGVNKNSRFVA